MPTRRHALGMLAATAAGAVAAPSLSGCSSDDSPTSSGKLEPVTYVTGFGAFGREGYAWVADAKGYFKQAGFDVSIKLGAAGDLNLKLLAADKAQFVVIDYAGGVVRAGNGAFDDFRLVSAVNQQTLISLMSLQGMGISTPRDLEGKTVGQATGAVPKTLFPAYAKLAGVDASKVKWQETEPQTLPGLLAAGKVDAIGQFVVGAPAVELASRGRKAVILPYSDFLQDLYGNVIVARADYVKKSPDKVRRFVNALLKGLRYTIAHPDESADILHQAQPATDAKTAAAEMKLMKSYIGTPFGAFEQAKVARSISLIESLGLIKQSLQPDAMVDFSVVPAKGR